ncbi:MAG: glutathione synthase [Proteobacteria bacterium]|nr:glutathione synthase [Pseudomonadota bacterium]
MILLCGIPSETPLRMVRERLDDLGVDYVLFNQRHFADSEAWFETANGEVRGELRIGPAVYALQDFNAVYTRLMDDRCLPELDGEGPESPLRRHCRGLHETLLRWMEIAPAMVINRCAAMASNSSKPYQAQLIEQSGLLTPPTLITSDPAEVRAFQARHGRVIYKSISAVRSIVHTLSEEDNDRLNRIQWCPTQFQGFVEGTNVRVHIAGNRVYATAIETEATDYRYAKRQAGEPAELREVELAEPLAEKCIALARRLGLVFAGIDLKITPDDRVYCFEVNPCPAFSYYEANTGQPISEGVALCLADADAHRATSDAVMNCAALA